MKYLSTLMLSLFMLVSFVSCGQKTKKIEAKKQNKDLSKYAQAVFASGCFWCVETAFESVIGVAEVISGYSGGKEANPTYEKVGSHETGHAEAIQVFYDPAVVSYATLLKVYFGSQNPTQVNGQGPDRGEPYRSIIFYRNASEKTQANSSKAEIQKKYREPIAAEIMAFEKFWPAEDYHQDYIKQNPNVPYVQGESIPRIKRFQKQYPELIKPGHKL